MKIQKKKLWKPQHEGLLELLEEQYGENYVEDCICLYIVFIVNMENRNDMIKFQIK